MKQARNKAHDAGRRDLRHVAGHLTAYGTLLTYIWHQRRTQNRLRDKPEGPYQRRRSASETTLRSGVLEKYKGNPLPDRCGKA